MEISSISTVDYIRIVAHYLCLLRGDKDHEADLIKRGYTPEQLQSVNVKRSISHVEYMGLKFTVPLTRFKYPLLGYVLKIVDNYEKGNLPFSGPITDQPAQIIEIIDTIQSLKVEYSNSIQKSK